MDTSIPPLIRHNQCILKEFSSGKACPGSNGSFIPSWQKGSFAWRIESADSTEFKEGGRFQCSFCSKIGGLTGIIHEVAHFEQLLTPVLILITGCDSISALHRCLAPTYSVKDPWHHCNLLSNLQAFLVSNSSAHTWMHVKAHQTKVTACQNLSYNIQLNEDMDALATRIMDNFPSSHLFPSNPTVVCHQSISRVQLSQAISSPPCTIILPGSQCRNI